MSSEERERTAEKEERDIIAESRRTAAEEQRAREDDERLVRTMQRARNEHQSGDPAQAARRREERLSEIEILMITKPCPSRRCSGRVYGDYRERQTMCTFVSLACPRMIQPTSDL